MENSVENIFAEIDRVVGTWCQSLNDELNMAVEEFYEFNFVHLYKTGDFRNWILLKSRFFYRFQIEFQFGLNRWNWVPLCPRDTRATKKDTRRFDSKTNPQPIFKIEWAQRLMIDLTSAMLESIERVYFISCPEWFCHRHTLVKCYCETDSLAVNVLLYPSRPLMAIFHESEKKAWDPIK